MSKFQKALNKLEKYGWEQDTENAWNYSAVIHERKHSYRLIINWQKGWWVILRKVWLGKVKRYSEYRAGNIGMHDTNSFKNINFCMTDGYREDELIELLDEIYNAATQLEMDFEGSFDGISKLAEIEAKEQEVKEKSNQKVQQQKLI